MTPRERLEFEQMKRDLDNIKRVTDTSFVAELARRLSGIQVKIEAGASTAGTIQTVRNSTNTGTEAVADQYVGVANLYINGTLLGKIGYY